MINKTTIFIVLAVLCLNFSANAQASYSRAKNTSPQTNTPLYVGDRLPESFWQQEHTIYANGKTIKQTLAAYQNKLLIIDFWATWCGSCIKKFSLLDSLQNQYAGELAVLLVNAKKSKDNTARVEETLKSHHFSSVLADTVLSLNFPHRMLPHYVWLHNGRVFAITDGTHLTPAMVALALGRYREIKGYGKPKVKP